MLNTHSFNITMSITSIVCDIHTWFDSIFTLLTWKWFEFLRRWLIQVLHISTNRAKSKFNIIWKITVRYYKQTKRQNSNWEIHRGHFNIMKASWDSSSYAVYSCITFITKILSQNKSNYLKSFTNIKTLSNMFLSFHDEEDLTTSDLRHSPDFKCHSSPMLKTEKVQHCPWMVVSQIQFSLN